MIKSSISLKALKSPWFVMAGLMAGILFGITSNQISMRLAPFGDIYLKFLTMCVIPIMISAVISSFGRLLASDETSDYLKKIGVVFLSGLVLTAITGLAAALIGNPGDGLDPETRKVIGNVLMQAEKVSVHSSVDPSLSSQGLKGFMEMLIPSNIFGALSSGKNLQILFFSLVFGFAIGMIPSSSRDHFLDLTEVVFKAFEKVISIAMYLLPLGLMCMIASQVASAGVDILIAMSRFVIIIHAAIFILLLMAGAIISFSTKKSFFRAFADLREPIIIAFGTRNSYATMPSMFDSLHRNFQTHTDIANLVVPLSIVLCRYSMIIVFSVGSVFMAQLYAVPLEAGRLAAILGSSILASLAGAGAPGIISLSMISIVLMPIGLPAEAAITLMLAVNFIIDPALTILNVYLTCAATVVIGKNQEVLAANEK